MSRSGRAAARRGARRRRRSPCRCGPRGPAAPAAAGLPQARARRAPAREAEAHARRPPQAQVDAAVAAGREEGYATAWPQGVAQAGAAAAAFAEVARGLDECAERLRERRGARGDGPGRRGRRPSACAPSSPPAPERVADVVRGAIRRAADRSALVARVEPAPTWPPAAPPAPGSWRRWAASRRLEVVDDPRISPGSCLLETSAGDVDATFDEPARPRARGARRAARRDAGRAPAVSLVDLAPARARLRALDPYRMNGRVSELIGLVVESRGPEASVGERCEIHVPGRRTGRPPLQAEVVGFREGKTLLMPLGDAAGVGPGQTVVASGGSGAGGRRRRPARPGARRPRPPDRRPARPGRRGAAPHRRRRRPDVLAPPHRSASPWRSACAPSTRSCPCGRGQRLGIFAGSGRRQEHAARDDGPRHQRRRQRDRPGRRARPRGARVHRARPRPRGPGAQRGGGRHLRPAGAGARSRPPSWPPRSPSTSATRAPTCC